jgi:RNA polymerase sigma-70 factor, ECF subfamily
MKERDCQTVFALLSEHLDQELAAENCEELERHIQGCEPCVEFVESLKKSITLGRGYQTPVKAAPLTPEVKESLKEAYARMLAARRK